MSLEARIKGRERPTEKPAGAGPWAWTVGLAVLAALAIEAALAEPGVSVGLTILRGMAWSAPAVLGAIWLRRREGEAVSPLPMAGALGLPALLFAPLVIDGVVRLAGGEGRMLEEVSLAGLRNLGLGLAVFSNRRGLARLAVLVGLFEVLAASGLGEGWLVVGLTAAFAVAGTAWLMGSYWEALPSRAREKGVLERRGKEAWRLGALGTGLALAVVGALALAVWQVPEEALAVLAGLVPSSGGSDQMDEEARGGVGDGPNEVEGRKDPKSVGFTQSELYLDTDKPSLYDAFNDMYGEPYKREKHEPAQAISSENVKEQKERPSENLKAGREFSTVRKAPRASKKPDDRETDALMYVKGRVPAHLRLTSYEEYRDGVWLEAPAGQMNAPLRPERPGSPWLRVEWPELPILAGGVTHTLKIGRLETSTVPSAGLLERFRVGSFREPRFFGWRQDQVMAVERRTIPAGTVVETCSRTFRPAGLRGLMFEERPKLVPARRLESVQDGPVAELARRWAQESGKPRGWSQVEALIDRLRTHAAHDRCAVAPEGCPDALEHFLLVSRKGPDYMFATAAALMLRSLGYPTRVAGGLYADPSAYDVVTRQVRVGKEDVHLWVEVLTPSGVWVPLEPTPGYRLMSPALSPIDQIVEWSRLGWAWCMRLKWPMLGLLGLAMVVVPMRRKLADEAGLLFWRSLAGRRSPREVILGAFRLIERRGNWAGRSRPAGWTPCRWYREMMQEASDGEGEELATLLALVDWSLHAPANAQRAAADLPPGWSAASVVEACDRTLKTWTVDRFKHPSKERLRERSLRARVSVPQLTGV